MKIMIDITERLYNVCCNSSAGMIMPIDIIAMKKAIQNGTPPSQEKASDQANWIPVSSGRLPEDGKNVMASTKCVVYPDARYTEKNGWEWAYEAGADYWDKLEGVIAWMPQPQHYKEEGD